MLRAFSILILFAGSLGWAADVSFATPPSARKDGDKTTIAFAVSARTDVEVAVLDAKGGIVRHLAAGVLGGEQAPPPPLKAGLSQSLAWDGKDDFGKPAQGGPFKVRVRAGMRVAFGRFLGGDTCRFGTVNGMATDADGTLYVSGFIGETNQNMITVRAFAPDGGYRRTLLPFPADLKPEQLKGIAEFDASKKGWIPNNQNSLNPTFYPWGTADANVIAATRSAVTLASGMTVFRFDPRGGLIDGPSPMWSPAAKLKCPTWLRIQVAASPDGKYLYYSNVAGTVYQPKSFKDTDPNWPQGRVYRQEVGSGKDPQPFYDLELPDWEKQKYWLPDAWNKRTAAYGLCVDAKGHVYVCDLVNQGIVEVGPDGKKIGFTKAPWPERVHVDEASGAYYVVSRLEQPKDGQVLKKLVKIAGRGDAGRIAAEFPFTQHGVGEATALGTMDGKPVLWAGGGGELLCIRDAGAKLELVATKFKPDPESQPDYNRLCADPVRDQVYVNTGTNRIWRYDGKTGQGELLKDKGKVFYATDLSVGYDGNLYIRSGEGYSGPLERRDTELKPVPYAATGSHVLTPYVYSRMGVGFSEHGIGVGPDDRCLFIFMYGWNKYCISAFGGNGKAQPGNYLKGKVNEPDPKTGKRPMPEEINSAVIGPLPMSNGGLRIDPQGNIYVGMRLSPEAAGAPPGFEKNNAYKSWIGCVVKFPPEGGTVLNTEAKEDQGAAEGTRVPVVHAGMKMELVNALKIYPGVGSFSGGGWGGNSSCCVCRVPRFDVDRFGRLALPNVVTNSVTILDNAGNEILTFGKYGNFDSQFRNPYAEGSAKDQPAIAEPEIPLAWPTGTGFSEKHVYVNDTYNRRVVRVDKAYGAEALADVK
ncbi:MAG: hypothetical protein KIS92_09095 [Planctomycetota bacterium]|nr:hypothetical protein [Planctomycetota bacterium]